MKWIKCEDETPPYRDFLGYCKEDGTIDHYTSDGDGHYYNMNSNNECTNGFLKWVTHWSAITKPEDV